MVPGSKTEAAAEESIVDSLGTMETKRNSISDHFPTSPYILSVGRLKISFILIRVHAYGVLIRTITNKESIGGVS